MKLQKITAIKFEIFDNNFVIYNRATFLRERWTDFHVSRINQSEKDKLFDYRLGCPQTSKNMAPDSRSNKRHAYQTLNKHTERKKQDGRCKS